jgi:hypothetical protein
MDYAFPAWRSAARTHVRRLQVLQSKCLRLVTGAPWYVSNREIHEDLGVPMFSDHFRDCELWLKVSWREEPSTTATRQIRWPRVDPVAWRETRGGRGQQASRGHRPRWPSRLNESRSALISRAPFSYPDWGFTWFFLSCKANSRVHDAKSGHGPHTPPPGAAASPKRLTKFAYLQFASKPICAQKPDSQPSKVYPDYN